MRDHGRLNEEARGYYNLAYDRPICGGKVSPLSDSLGNSVQWRLWNFASSTAESTFWKLQSMHDKVECHFWYQIPVLRAARLPVRKIFSVRISPQSPRPHLNVRITFGELAFQLLPQSSVRHDIVELCRTKQSKVQSTHESILTNQYKSLDKWHESGSSIENGHFVGSIVRPWNCVCDTQKPPNSVILNYT